MPKPLRVCLLILLGCLLPAGGVAQKDNYKIQPNDLLDIRVYEEDDLNTTARVGADGRIAMPLIGAVKVSGLSVQQAVEKLQAAYRRGYLVSPQVSLLISEHGQQTFTVLGQVVRPGNYALDGTKTMTLIEAIGLAGGYTRIASPSRITILRRSGSQATLLKVDGRSNKGEDPVTVIIQPNDVITVGESLF